MNPDWIESVREKLKRKNQMLFSSESECLQELLALLELQEHRTLVLWAFLCVEKPIEILGEHYVNEKCPEQALKLCKDWAAGKIKMPIAKKAILRVHKFAKEIDSLEDIALCHAVGQACSTVHVGTHAIGLPIYELTAIVRKYGVEKCVPFVENRIKEYIDTIMVCKRKLENEDYIWAEFLC